MYTKSAEVAEKNLATVLSHGTLYECSRAYLLMAKCRVASSSANHEERRAGIYNAISYLKLAHQGFKTMQSHHRSKDVLYMMVIFYYIF